MAGKGQTERRRRPNEGGGGAPGKAAGGAQSAEQSTTGKQKKGEHTESPQAASGTLARPWGLERSGYNRGE